MKSKSSKTKAKKHPVKFAADAEAVATKAIRDNGGAAALARSFRGLIKFLAANPAEARSLRGKHPPHVGTEEYIRRQAVLFARGRDLKNPKLPKTVSDPAVSLILQSYWGIVNKSLKAADKYHRRAMSAENCIGHILEQYLASVLEPAGWIWCSGNGVRAVDFIKPPSRPGGRWERLQVKNRDNSENSSSGAVRANTDIKIWFRTFSNKAGSNWAAFPDASVRHALSEPGFMKFIRAYIRALTPVLRQNRGAKTKRQNQRKK